MNATAAPAGLTSPSHNLPADGQTHGSPASARGSDPAAPAARYARRTLWALS
jgi:hypothetical protein